MLPRFREGRAIQRCPFSKEEDHAGEKPGLSETQQEADGVKTQSPGYSGVIVAAARTNEPHLG